MSTTADGEIAARRLRRRLNRVRLLLLAAVFVAGWALLRDHGGAGGGGPSVRALTVDGLITDEPRRVRAVEAAARDDSVRALILRIDSPGGSVAGGERLHDAIAAFAGRKPVVAVMGGEAASAGYMIAVPAARIFASNATLTGSIGVILESPDLSGLLGRIGVSVDQLVSGPLKGQPSLTAPISPAGRAMLQGVVADLFGQFVDMVAAGRHMDRARVLSLADGRPYTGHQALPLGLIDQIGDEDDARAWLARNRHVDLDLPVRDIDWRPHDHGWAGLFGSLLKTVLPQGVMLDGGLALWQGPRP